jgi:hypothetical protein
MIKKIISFTPEDTEKFRKLKNDPTHKPPNDANDYYLIHGVEKAREMLLKLINN